MRELSKEPTPLYPDLLAAGGLTHALQAALDALGSPLRVTGLDPGVKFIVYARVEAGPRFSQVCIAAHERLFMPDFWGRGVCLANAATPDLAQAAGAIHRWVGSTCSTTELAAEFPFVEVAEVAAAYERGEEVELRWRKYLTDMGEHHRDLVPFVQAAAGHPRLRQLFPYTSMYHFCFSRCTGYPFTGDTPHVTPRPGGGYDVHGPDRQLLGSGDAAEAVRLVVKNLPPGCGPAIAGTAEDMPG